MKRLATLQSVYSLHQQALGGKAYSQYTDDEIKLHVQSLTIANCIADYAMLERRVGEMKKFIATSYAQLILLHLKAYIFAISPLLTKLGLILNLKTIWLGF